MARGFLDRLLGRRGLTESGISSAFRGTFRDVCPVCSQSLEEHQYLLFGQFDATEGQVVADRVTAQVSENQWAALRVIENWNHDKDHIQVFLIKCPRSTSQACCVVHSYASPILDDRVTLVEPFPSADPALSDVARGDWRSF